MSFSTNRQYVKMQARYRSHCPECQKEIAFNQWIIWAPAAKSVYCLDCMEDGFEEQEDGIRDEMARIVKAQKDNLSAFDLAVSICEWLKSEGFVTKFDNIGDLTGQERGTYRAADCVEFWARRGENEIRATVKHGQH